MGPDIRERDGEPGRSVETVGNIEASRAETVRGTTGGIGTDGGVPGRGVRGVVEKPMGRRVEV